MKNKKSRKNIYISLSLVVLLVIIGISTHYLINNILKTPSIIKDNPINNTKAYSNEVDGFKFEYPNSYKIKETIQEGNTLLDLEKDQEWDNDGYNLSKGAWVRITYLKDTESFEKYVKGKNRDALEVRKTGELEKKTINNIDVLEIIYDNPYPLKFSGIKTVYFKNKDAILELSFMLGNTVTKNDYDSYVKDFDSIVKSVAFIN